MSMVVVQLWLRGCCWLLSAGPKVTLGVQPEQGLRPGFEAFPEGRGRLGTGWQYYFVANAELGLS